jgi:hypothetical protein
LGALSVREEKEHGGWRGWRREGGEEEGRLGFREGLPRCGLKEGKGGGASAVVGAQDHSHATSVEDDDRKRERRGRRGTSQEVGLGCTRMEGKNIER